ncbi:MAG: undecaprenyl-phosphate glucose phosphotransferase [Methylovirgula sp.]|uniref:undecaprenyl-phosphate glucose phosphotransferase n=1 Tax=Methylovirgula sp. TaxID=1978224 RepID=UPI0030762F19
MVKFSLSDLQKTEPVDKAPPAADMSSEALAAAARAMQSSNSVPGLSRVVLEGLVRCVEFLLIAAAGFAIHFFYIARTQGYAQPYLIGVPCVAAAAVLALQSAELYKISALRRFPADSFRLAGALTFVFAATLVLIFFLKLDEVFSRVFMLAWYGSSLVALCGERAALALLVDRLIQTGRLARRTVLVGGGTAADALLNQLAAQPQPDLQILGIFDDRTDERSPPVVAGFPKLGTVDDLLAFSRRTRIDLIIFTLPITAEQRILQMLRKLWVLPIDIRLAAHMNKLHFRPHSYSYIGSVPLIDIFDKPIAGWDVIVKYAFDKIVGALCLILLAPVMAIVALAVKLDSKGPALFRQKRYGFNNEIVEVYKFRSMRADMLDFAATKLVTKDDPRVTRVGRFIRKTSLDELPQLFNVVFKGNLSLVGPRPHALHAKAAERQYDEVVDGYFARHRVSPGITGWAQIHGWRGETDTPEKIQGRVECDLYYIENWSILLDIYILLATPFALLRTKNAY